jgi:hypothetical protein
MKNKEPHLVRLDCDRRGEKWSEYHCSQCNAALDKTARFCATGCGAWFKRKRRAK